MLSFATKSSCGRGLDVAVARYCALKAWEEAEEARSKT
jgi:hypothetical protein